MTFRWTPNPRWYEARGWRIVASKAGVDYVSYLVVVR